MTHALKLERKKFGKLTIIERIPNMGEKSHWLAKCECGQETVVRGDNLMIGKTKSCGCGVAEASRDRLLKRQGKLKILKRKGSK